MGQILSNTILPFVIAFFTVVGTAIVRNHYNRLNALKALKTEVQHNDRLAESTLHDLYSGWDSSEENSAERDTIPLQTSAYNSFVNSGYATRLSDNVADEIWYHYLMIRKLNGFIERRMDPYVDHKRTDEQILEVLGDLSGSDRLELMISNIRGNPWADGRLRDHLDNQEKYDESNEDSENPRYQTFENIEPRIHSEIEKQRYLPNTIHRFASWIRGRLPF